MATTVRDTTSSDRDNFTAVAVRSVPVPRRSSQPLLPTPPNSISPPLPAGGLKFQLQRARPDAIDSDLDLQAVHPGDSGHQQQPRGLLDPHRPAAPSPDGLPGTTPPNDLTGAISPPMLAKFHLPEILLNHGPLAIRHIVGYLLTSVPGFSGIPAGKARRLVVAALEGRGSGGDASGGQMGDVKFEKVGWGRWDARRRGQPRRGEDSAAAAPRGGSPGSDSTGSTTSRFLPTGIPIGRAHGGANRDIRHRSRKTAGKDATSWSSTAFSHEDRYTTAFGTGADRMSLDGERSASCSEALEGDDAAQDDLSDEATDDEDWAAVGAAALRASSYHSPPAGFAFSFSLNPGYLSSSRAGGFATLSNTRNAGVARVPQTGPLDFSGTALAGAPDAQEREAVEALLRLGSV